MDEYKLDSIIELEGRSWRVSAKVGRIVVLTLASVEGEPTHYSQIKTIFRPFCG